MISLNKKQQNIKTGLVAPPKVKLLLLIKLGKYENRLVTLEMPTLEMPSTLLKCSNYALNCMQ